MFSLRLLQFIYIFVCIRLDAYLCESLYIGLHMYVYICLFVCVHIYFTHVWMWLLIWMFPILSHQQFSRICISNDRPYFVTPVLCFSWEAYDFVTSAIYLWTLCPLSAMQYIIACRQRLLLFSSIDLRWRVVAEIYPFWAWPCQMRLFGIKQGFILSKSSVDLLENVCFGVAIGYSWSWPYVS